MAFDVGVLTRLENELKKQETKLKSLVSIGKTIGHVQQGATPGLVRALRDFATELHRVPSLVEWLQNKAQADQLRWERQNEERRVPRQSAEAVPLVDDRDINGILAEQGIPKSDQDFKHLAVLLTDDEVAYLNHPVTGLGMIESAQRAFNELRREIEGTQRRDELMTVVRTAVEAAKVLPEEAVDDSGKPDDDATYSFEVHSEVVRICGFDEDVTLENTEGVQRLIAVVAAPTRRASVMELSRIGAAQTAADRDLIDRDSDGLTERESVNGERFESALGVDALQAARNAVVDLIAERNAALSDGDEDKAKSLTKQISASLDRPKTGLQEAAGVVRKSLDRTYERLRKDGKGDLLASHFEKHVQRPRQSRDFVYEPDESVQKISWNLK